MIEWCASSYFSFLEGVSSPTELIETAQALGYQGLGLADRMGQHGLVEALRARDTHTQAHPEAQKFFFAPGIRLHFDIAEPLIVYPLHKAAHGTLCRFLSEWALEGMTLHEKGLTPLPWTRFKTFLRQEKSKAPLEKSFILISVNGRFFSWVEAPLENNEYRLPQTKKNKSPELTRVQAHEARAPTPSFSNPPTHPGFCPLWLLELVDLCGRGKNSALSLAYPLTFSPGIEDLIDWLEEQSRTLTIPLLATTLPLFADKSDQDLADLACAIRHTSTLKDLGYLAQANGERSLLKAHERKIHGERLLTRLQNQNLINDPIAHSLDLAARQHFSLSELHYRYPKENIPPDHTATSYLRHLTFEGALSRYPEGLPVNVRTQLEHELSLISQLEYEDYFLTIWDILKYARSQNILFQGRGSAANSTVCFCLGITAIDPVRMNLLFERFLSVERHEPPDIDVDFEHERREEVMQEVYRRYGRHKAAMVATYICFRTRMAVHESAKALGFPLEALEEIKQLLGREGLSAIAPKTSQDSKPANTKPHTPSHPAPPSAVAPETPHLSPEVQKLLSTHRISLRTWQRLLNLAPRLVGTPRHLGIHTGGFILAADPLTEQCILAPGRMKDRSVVPWDKIDVEYLQWMKVDLLSLGMLSAIRKCFDHLKDTQNLTLDLKSVPAECPKVYAALGRADTVGVFQIESRAQMNMLPRLLPKTFYDLVVEVAIVRPGPLQGGMVHPYLRRRQKLEPVTYDHPSLKPILEKTMGVPIFQEQVMKMAVAIAGFTPGEADQLRKVMSGAWRSKSHMHRLKDKLLKGMCARGVTGDFAERVYKQIEGFGEYGFPESHAASFAILTYVSSYLKVHHPAEFVTSLLNSQPMGFYSARALIHDAERHGVRVLPVDLFRSRYDCTLEHNAQNPTIPAVRMGFRLVRSFSKEEAEQIEALQHSGVLSEDHEATPSIQDLRARYQLDIKTLDKLIRAGALHRLSHEQSAPRDRSPPRDVRRQELWQLSALKRSANPAQESFALENAEKARPESLNTITAWESLLQDYLSTGLTPQSLGFRSDFSHYHPAQFARHEFFADQGWAKSSELFDIPARTQVKVIGLVSTKQKPPTAGGLVFVTMEDEHGFFNLVLMPEVYAKARLILESGSLLAAEGHLEKSLNTQSSDKQSVAISIKVSYLWNPFIHLSSSGAAQNAAQSGELQSKSRSWH